MPRRLKTTRASPWVASAMDYSGSPTAHDPARRRGPVALAPPPPDPPHRGKDSDGGYRAAGTGRRSGPVVPLEPGEAPDRRRVGAGGVRQDVRDDQPGDRGAARRGRARRGRGHRPRGARGAPRVRLRGPVAADVAVRARQADLADRRPDRGARRRARAARVARQRQAGRGRARRRRRARRRTCSTTWRAGRRRSSAT